MSYLSNRQQICCNSSRTAFTLYNLSQMVSGLCVMVWRKRKGKQEKKERQTRKMRVIYDHGGQ